MLKLRPNLLIGTTFNEFSKFPTNFKGPSTIGLKKILRDALYTAIVPDLLHIAIRN